MRVPWPLGEFYGQIKINTIELIGNAMSLFSLFCHLQLLRLFSSFSAFMVQVNLTSIQQKDYQPCTRENELREGLLDWTFQKSWHCQHWIDPPAPLTPQIAKHKLEVGVPGAPRLQVFFILVSKLICRVNIACSVVTMPLWPSINPSSSSPPLFNWDLGGSIKLLVISKHL